MNIMKKILLIAILLFIAGCSQQKDFGYGIKQINNINQKHNLPMDTYPNDMKQIELMHNEFIELKKIQLDRGAEPFNDVIDYELLNLEAQKLYINSQKYGKASTTKYGFGCKMRPLVMESVYLRNASALKAFESVDLLSSFFNKYPGESAAANLSRKNALFLNATFYRISNEASGDSNVMNYFCPENVTLDIYKKAFKKDTDLNKDYIDTLTYEESVRIWKHLEELD